MVSQPTLEAETITAIERPAPALGALPALEIVGALKQFRKEESQTKAFWNAHPPSLDIADPRRRRDSCVWARCAA